MLMGVDSDFLMPLSEQQYMYHLLQGCCSYRSQCSSLSSTESAVLY